MEGIDVSVGQKVLLLWSGSSPTQDLEETVSDLKDRVKDTGKVQVEHVDRLSLGKTCSYCEMNITRKKSRKWGLACWAGKDGGAGGFFFGLPVLQ